jgi:23S rRNA G2069 N7-methylase RlmK/C1962 C5-methylase RlmI
VGTSVRIAKSRARPFWHGNPIVFSGAIDRVDGDPAPGDLVDVQDELGRTIGQGFWNARSMYRVRLVRLDREEALPRDPAGLIAGRIAAAAALRRPYGLPSDATDAYRLVNSEGDGLSGLTVDRFGGVLVVQESALWTQVHRAAVARALDAVAPGATLVHRISAAIAREEGLDAPPGAAPVGTHLVRENGLAFAVTPDSGQKTGFFCDQRENRALVRRLAAGRTVLDAFCYSGGFALNAAAGGATSVLGVDSSVPAIETAIANATANGLDAAFETRDALQVLESGGAWDLVVCDPPKLARNRSDLPQAMERYRRLNRAALRSTRPGGILVTCSCSSAVRRDMFVDVVRDAAAEAGRTVTLLEARGAGPDHPVRPAYPESEYLKCLVLGVL